MSIDSYIHNAQKELTVMRPVAEVLIPVVLVGYLTVAVAVAGEQERAVPPCGGPYANRTPTSEELAAVLGNHQAWLGSGREPGDERRANLCQANLQGVGLPGADLQGANLLSAILAEADLRRANLQGANLFNARVQGAVLHGTDLAGADLSFANLQGAVYEPNPDPAKLPAFWTLIYSRNQLDKLVFRRSPAALVVLREAFKKGGMHTQERQLTYAIEHTKMRQAWDPPEWLLVWDPGELGWVWGESDPKGVDTRPWLEKLWGKLESVFKLVAFELPSDYGMSYGRPLKILVGSITGFSFLYVIALFTARGRAGIWVTWPTDRVYQEEGAKEATRVTTMFFFPRLQAWAAGRWWGVFLRGVSVPLIGLYFSLLSSFSLGWRELNVGTWIARVQPREYVLRATGWVRTVSGIQSLLSVYLLALWVLTYFGRPFE
jgi:pentapeptide repeat protein